MLSERSQTQKEKNYRIDHQLKRKNTIMQLLEENRRKSSVARARQRLLKAHLKEGKIG